MKNNRKHVGCYLTTQCLQQAIDTDAIAIFFFFNLKNTKDNTNFDTATSVLHVKPLIEDDGICTEIQTWNQHHHIFME